MGSLFTALRNTGSSMRVFERAIGVVQGNVANASTPGYARQQQALMAMRFDLDSGLAGGVASGGTIDTRSAFADSMVRRRLTTFGEADERTNQLERLEPLFDIAANSGLNAAMGRFFQSASALTIAPNDTAARKVLLDRAREVAGSFNAAADGLSSARHALGKALGEQMDRVETIAAGIVSINRQFRVDARGKADAGLQTRLNSLLEELSEVAETTVLRAEDGSATVYLGGQSLLVIGDRQYDVSVDTGGAAARVLDWQGNDISPLIQSGRVAALLELRNGALPEFQDRMDRLAESFADQVNAVLAGGVDLQGATPVQTLFTYDATLGSARTLKVNGMAPAELALADPLSPGGNDVALQLAALAQDPAIDGLTYSQYYAGMAADVGRSLATSREDLSTQQSLKSQAQGLRDETQAVDLNEEALILLQYQRSYEAAAKMIQTLDEMTQTVLQLMR
jgi:flagellar hook-associated protein 1 FlgK